MEQYIQKALEFEADYNRRVYNNEQGRRPPVCEMVPLTLSPKHLFLKDETIVVKIHQTEKLGRPWQGDLPFLHRHDFFEFNYVYRGKIKNILKNHTLMQEPNQLLMMNPLAVHDPRIADPDTVLFNILVERHWAETVFSSFLTFNEQYFHFFMDMLYGLERHEAYLLFDCTAEIAMLLQSIIREYYDQRPGYQQMLAAHLTELFVCCTRQSYTQHLEQEKKQMQSKTIADILTYLRIHYAEATLSNTAKIFNYSPTYLSRLIKQKTNQNFSEILRNLKLENACTYLQHSNLSIELITEHIGYKDSSHFAKAFCQAYGMNPNQYRQEKQRI